MLFPVSLLRLPSVLSWTFQISPLGVAMVKPTGTPSSRTRSRLHAVSTTTPAPPPAPSNGEASEPEGATIPSTAPSATVPAVPSSSPGVDLPAPVEPNPNQGRRLASEETLSVDILPSVGPAPPPDVEVVRDDPEPEGAAYSPDAMEVSPGVQSAPVSTPDGRASPPSGGQLEAPQGSPHAGPAGDSRASPSPGGAETPGSPNQSRPSGSPRSKPADLPPCFTQPMEPLVLPPGQRQDVFGVLNREAVPLLGYESLTQDWHIRPYIRSFLYGFEAEDPSIHRIVFKQLISVYRDNFTDGKRCWSRMIQGTNPPRRFIIPADVQTDQIFLKDERDADYLEMASSHLFDVQPEDFDSLVLVRSRSFCYPLQLGGFVPIRWTVITASAGPG